jgi:hypothetical protein
MYLGCAYVDFINEKFVNKCKVHPITGREGPEGE